jgi:hypothetical protein
MSNTIQNPVANPAGNNPVPTVTSGAADAAPPTVAGLPDGYQETSPVTLEAFQGQRGPLGQQISISFDPELLARYPELANGGHFTSQIEHEVKWGIDVSKVPELVGALEAMVADPAKIKALLGEGWTVQPVKKVFQYDGQGNRLFGANGLPLVNPANDTYYDSEKLELTSKQIALRFRPGKNGAPDSVEVKPGPGAPGANGVSTRLEYGLEVSELVKANPAAIAKFLQSGEHLNPFRLVLPLIPGLDVSGAVKPAIDLSSDKYKYQLVHTSGATVELSIDDVTAQSRTHLGPDGKPLHGRFAQFELELGHDSSSKPVEIAGQPGGKPQFHLPTDVSGSLNGNGEALLRFEALTKLAQETLLKNQMFATTQKGNAAGRSMKLIK